MLNTYLPPNSSVSFFMSFHHTFLPLRFFISAASTRSPTGAKMMDEPWIVMTDADSRMAFLLLSLADLRDVACCSTKCMHFIASRTARARSKGEGMPPCNVCPSEADRASKSEAPSSWRILVRISVV